MLCVKSTSLVISHGLYEDEKGRGDSLLEVEASLCCKQMPRQTHSGKIDRMTR